MENDVVMKIAGSSKGKNLTIHPGSWQCGDVKDGVSFRFDNEPGFVVEFTDFERAYLAAKQNREGQ